MGKIGAHPIHGEGLRVATGRFTAVYNVTKTVEVGFQPLFVIVYTADNVSAGGSKGGNYDAKAENIPRIFARGDYSEIPSTPYDPGQKIIATGFQFKFYVWQGTAGETSRDFYYIAVG